MVVAVVVLVASKLTVFTEGRIVKIVAVTVDAVFGKVFVVGDLIAIAEFASLCPGFGLDFKEFDISRIICFAD